MKLIDGDKLLKDIKENMHLEYMSHEDIVHCIEDSINRQVEIEITEKKKIEYHVYGRIAKEAYNFYGDYSIVPFQITRINKNTANDLFKLILLRGDSKILKEDNFFVKTNCVTDYKFYKTIYSDIELKSKDFIAINNQDYEIINVCNLDKNIHEIYLNDFICEYQEDKELKEGINKLEKELRRLISEHNAKVRNNKTSKDFETKPKKSIRKRIFGF